MPKSKLSRRIAKLEERLGVRLIQRSTRHFVVTEAGQTYYMHCKAMLVEAEAAQEAIDTLKAEPRGVIRMTCPLPLVHAYVGVMLADFMVRYPHVTVHMKATNRRVDLVSESVDLALRVRRPPLEDSDPDGTRFCRRSALSGSWRREGRARASPEGPCGAGIGQRRGCRGRIVGGACIPLQGRIFLRKLLLRPSRSHSRRRLCASHPAKPPSRQRRFLQRRLT
jgi:DNA-binding transcriptional LysR family regulator